MGDNHKDCQYILTTYHNEMMRLAQWEYCEYEYDFLGFLDVYQNLNIPKDFIILDLGCYQACQCIYFKDYPTYIGVDIAVPIEYRFNQNNAIYYQCDIIDFIKTMKLNPNKVFAICSYVPDPDKNIYNLIKEKFPYHKIQYCNDIISENYPLN